MRRLLLMMSVSLLLLTAAACGSKEEVTGNGEGPADIPVEWVNAEVQKNQSKMLELLDEKSKALDSEDKADNQLVIKNYKLTEWKASNDRYFYEVVYEHPEKSVMVTERMEVIKTDSGWKRTTYSDLHNFGTLVADIESKVLKGLHEE